MSVISEKQIRYMVDRFLSWKLPEHFTPDGGISFKKIFNEGTPHAITNRPSGTNLFDDIQAGEMVRHMIEGLPEDAETKDPLSALLHRIERVEQRLALLEP